MDINLDKYDEQFTILGKLAALWLMLKIIF